MRRGVGPGALIVLALAACSSASAPGSLVVESGRWELRLPVRCEHWRGDLLADLRCIEAGYDLRAARWPAEDDETLRIVVAADVDEARAISEELELEGDPRTPRTHPDKRLALIPLPRNDYLVLERSHPPRTWRETLRHEAAHLLSLDRPALLASPLWFQEGLAEEWTQLPGEGPAGAWSSDGAGAAALLGFLEEDAARRRAPVLLELHRVPSEARLAAWREIVGLVMDHDHLEPWVLADEIRGEALAHNLRETGVRPRPAFRGRELSPPESGDGWLLAAYPGESVAARLWSDWSGEQDLEFSVRVGRTGLPEAGLTLTGRGGLRLRVRFGRHGEAAAYLEDREAVLTRPMDIHRALGVRRDTLRRFGLGVSAGELVLRSGATSKSFPLEPELFEPPFALEFYVHDGALLVEALPDGRVQATGR